MPRERRSRRRRPLDVECEDCKEKLEFMDEANGIAICPKCFTVYDLRKFKRRDDDRTIQRS